MGLDYNEIDDLVNSTQQKLIKGGAFVGMQTDLQDHVAVRELWKNKKKAFDGGVEWRFDLQMDHNHSARTVGLYETDGSSVADTLTSATVGPRHVNAHYIYDVLEPDFQRGGLAIVNLIKSRYVSMMVSLFELMEEILWGKPTDSSDTLTPFGVAYWVTRSTVEGFNGGNPAGFSDGRAGIDTGTYPRFANWTAQYANITKEDLIRKMRKAHRQSRFRSPIQHATPELSMGNGIFTNDNVIGIMEEILETQNMNLGNDLNSKEGRTMFKSTPIQWAPHLDNDSTDPVLMLDFKRLAVGVMSGWENQLSKPYMVPSKHNVRRVDLDCSMNMVCTDPRRQAIICK